MVLAPGLAHASCYTFLDSFLSLSFSICEMAQKSIPCPAGLSYCFPDIRDLRVPQSCVAPLQTHFLSYTAELVQ